MFKGVSVYDFEKSCFKNFEVETTRLDNFI